MLNNEMPCRVGARHDCPSVAQVVVVLDDGTDVLPSYTGAHAYTRQHATCLEKAAFAKHVACWRGIGIVHQAYSLF